MPVYLQIRWHLLMAVDDIYLLCHINFAQAKCSKCGKELKGMDAAQVVE